MISWLKERFHKLGSINDHSLVKKTKQGDRDAFGKLYLKYLDSIYRYIYFRVNQNTQEAEDLTEVVFFKTWESIDKFNDKEGNFKSWVYRIAHNTVADHYRQKHDSVSLTDSIADHKDNVEEQVIKKDHFEYILRAIQLLTEEQKQIITMKYIDGLSNRQIASIVNKREDAIRAIQYRALKHLRSVLK